MQEQEQTQAQQAMQTPVELTLTLADVNGILQCMHEAPYKTAKPLIDKVTEQAQTYINQLAAQQRPDPAANPVPQQPAANQIPQMPQTLLRNTQ